jgi:TonB family protein
VSTILPLLVLVASLAQASLAESPPAVRVGEKVTPPKKTKGGAPEYPPEAKRAGMMGVVILECTISPTGVVVDARVLKGAPVLNEAAIEAVRKWRYTPTLLDGVAVPVIMTVTVNFKLDQVRVPDLIASLTHESETIRAVAAENLGWVGKARLGNAVPEAIRALEELAARDPSAGVRGTAARSLSRIDGRPLEGQPAVEPESSQPSSLQLAILGGGEARPVAWGFFIDPSGECAVEARADRVDIGIPAGTYDLSSELGRVTAPRVMRLVTGDLTAQVTVDELPLPIAAPGGPASLPFRGGGLLLWLDRRNYGISAINLSAARLRAGFSRFQIVPATEPDPEGKRDTAAASADP